MIGGGLMNEVPYIPLTFRIFTESDFGSVCLQVNAVPPGDMDITLGPQSKQTCFPNHL